MSHLIVYCARPITGCKFNEIEAYYRRITTRLSAISIQVFIPAWRRDFHEGDRKPESDGSWASPEIDRDIKEGDKWLVQHSDILFANLVDAVQASIGSAMEIAWADDVGVKSVVVMDKSGIHRHPFVCNCAARIYSTEEEALRYLETLAPVANS